MKRSATGLAFFLAPLLMTGLHAAELNPDELAVVQLADERELNDVGIERADGVLPDLRLAPGRSAVAGETSATTYGVVAELTASNQNSQNSLKLLMQTRSGPPTEFDDRGNMRWDSTLQSLSLILSAPFNPASQSSPGAIATATLPTSFQAKLGFSNFVGHMVSAHRTMTSLKNDALDKCVETRTASPELDESTKAREECRKLKFDELVSKYLPTERQAFDSATIGSAYIYGGYLSAGYNNLTFYDTTTAIKESVTHVPWSVSGFVGVTPTAGAILLLASATYQDIFYGQPSGTICPNGADGNFIRCATGALGAPKELKQTLFSLEPRAQVGVNGPFGISSIGIDPKFSYDVENGIYGFETRLTLGQTAPAESSSPQLSAGLDFGWQSDKHVFVAGLFVGAPFSLYDQ